MFQCVEVRLKDLKGDALKKAVVSCEDGSARWCVPCLMLCGSGLQEQIVLDCFRALFHGNRMQQGPHFETPKIVMDRL